MLFGASPAFIHVTPVNNSSAIKRKTAMLEG